MVNEKKETQEEKDILNDIFNSPENESEKIENVFVNGKLQDVMDPSCKLNTNDLIEKDLDDTQASDLLDKVKNDPELVKLLLEANPDLMQKAKCIKDPKKCEDFLYDKDGAEV